MPQWCKLSSFFWVCVQLIVQIPTIHTQLRPYNTLVQHNVACSKPSLSLSLSNFEGREFLFPTRSPYVVFLLLFQEGLARLRAWEYMYCTVVI